MQVDEFPLLVEYFSPSAKCPKVVATGQSGFNAWQDSVTRTRHRSVLASDLHDTVASSPEAYDMLGMQEDDSCLPQARLNLMEPSGPNGESEEHKRNLNVALLEGSLQRLSSMPEVVHNCSMPKILLHVS